VKKARRKNILRNMLLAIEGDDRGEWGKG